MTDAIRFKLSPTVTKEFGICFVSFTMLLLSNIFGTIAIVGFILPWLWLGITRPRKVWRSLILNWQLFLFPALAFVSTAWSIEPAWTLRASLEFITTFAIGIIAAERIAPHTLLSAFLVALLVIAGLSVLSGNSNIVGTSGETALTGIFGSKNAFSTIMSLLLLTSISLFIDKNYGLILRLCAIGGIFIAPILLYFGRSLDSIVASFLTIMAFVALRRLWRVPVSLRLLGLIGIIGVAIIIAYIIILYDLHPARLLAMMGKNSSLTGRTYLWSRALDFIGDRPLLGVGYQAFWRVDNPHAQELWLYAGVPFGAGFGFHNEYLQMLVDEGALGIILLLGFIFIVSKRATVAICKGLRHEQNFAVMTFIYLMLRTPLESALFAQFNIGTILLCVIWVYFKPSEINSPLKNEVT